MTAIPTSVPQPGSGLVSKPQRLVQSTGIDPKVQEKLSRIFHIPRDFIHRLAAQTGYIDYDPATTARPPISAM